jgi:prepilin-type N-terminal cleavage/methylation domain-containing protein
MQNKKGFTLIELMIVVAIIAILAMIAIPMYQRYIERSRNSASQSLLQQLALAETAYNVDNADYILVGATGGDAAVQELGKYGFRPDPQVAFVVEAATAGSNASPGYVAFAIHVAAGSTLYAYDNIASAGVEAVIVGKEYANGGTYSANAPSDITPYGMKSDGDILMGKAPSSFRNVDGPGSGSSAIQNVVANAAGKAALTN